MLGPGVSGLCPAVFARTRGRGSGRVRPVEVRSCEAAAAGNDVACGRQTYALVTQPAVAGHALRAFLLGAHPLSLASRVGDSRARGVVRICNLQVVVLVRTPVGTPGSSEFD